MGMYSDVMSSRKILVAAASFALLALTALPSQAVYSAERPWWPKVPSIGFSSTEAFTPGVRETSWVTGYSYAEGATSGFIPVPSLAHQWMMRPAPMQIR